QIANRMVIPFQYPICACSKSYLILLASLFLKGLKKKTLVNTIVQINPYIERINFKDRLVLKCRYMKTRTTNPNAIIALREKIRNCTISKNDKKNKISRLAFGIER